MPHKHKRRGTDGGDFFNLPPTSTAKPLAAFHQQSGKSISARETTRRREKRGRGTISHDGSGKIINKEHDDTPRAFARLLRFHQTGKGLPSALDDGRPKKKRKREGQQDQPVSNAQSDRKEIASEATATTTPGSTLKIKSGERLGDFYARVDQNLPFSQMRQSTAGSQNNNNNDNRAQKLGVKEGERQTKHNRRLERMQKQWREEEARRQEKLTEQMEDREDEREEQELLWSTHGPSRAPSRGQAANGLRKVTATTTTTTTTTKKGKRRKGTSTAPGENEEEEEEDDPWAELERKKIEATRQKSLQDVVQAPPQLRGVAMKMNRFKRHHDNSNNNSGNSNRGSAGDDTDTVLVDVENVPTRVGSLRRREQAAGLRRRLIDEYRTKERQRQRGRGRG